MFVAGKGKGRGKEGGELMVGIKDQKVEALKNMGN